MIAASWGLAALSRPIDAEFRYALWLNRDLAAMAQGQGMAAALRMIMTLGKMPYQWFNFQCDWPEEVADVEYKVNADRTEAAFFRKRG